MVRERACTKNGPAGDNPAGLIYIVRRSVKEIWIKEDTEYDILLLEFSMALRSVFL